MTDTFYYSEKITPSDSSFADAVYYHGGGLLIETVHGDSLYYEDVPQETFDGLKAASSIGRYYHEDIRGKYPFSNRNDLFVAPIETLRAAVDERKDALASAAESEITGNAVETELRQDYTASTKRYSVYVTFDSLEKASTFLSYAEADSIAASLHVEGERL